MPEMDTPPNWTFKVDEVSSGVYRVIARHQLGASIELTGMDCEDLLRRARNDAVKFEKDLERLRKI